MRKIIRLPLYFLLAVSVIIVAVAYVYYFTTLPESEINNYLRSFAGRQFGLDVRIQKVNRDIWNRLILEGVEISSPKGLPVVFISRIELDYDIVQLARGKYGLKRLEIDSLSARMPEEKMALPTSRRSAESKPPGISVGVDNILLRTANITLASGEVISIDSLRSRLDIVKGDLNIQLGALSARWPGRQIEFRSLSGKLIAVDGRYQVDSLAIRTGASNVIINGSLDQSFRRGLDLTFRADPINLDDISRLTGTRVQGELVAQGTLKGSWDDFEGEVRINGTFFDKPFENVDVSYAYSNKLIRFNAINGGIFNADFSGSGELDLSSKPPEYVYNGTVRHLDLREIGPELKTDFTGGVHLKGTGFSAKDFFMAIDANLDSVRIDTYYFDKISGPVKFDLETINFLAGFQGRYKDTYITASGYLEYQGNLDITGTAMFEDLTDFSGQIFLKELGGKGKADFRATGKTIDFDIQGAFESDSCWTYGLLPDSLSIYADLKSFISHKVGNVIGGWSGGLMYSTPVDSGYFQASVSGERVFFDTVSVWAPRGVMALSGGFDGTSVPPVFYADTLFGNYATNEFHSVEPIVLLVREYETEFDRFILGLETGRMKITGTVTNDLVLDLDVRAEDFQIGPLVSQFYKDKALRGVWWGNARIRGKFENPEIDIGLRIDSLSIDEVSLGKLDAVLTYRNGYIRADSTHLKSDYGEYYFTGNLPINFSFGEVEERLPNNPIDFRMVASGSRLLLSEVFIPTIERLETDFVVEMSLGGTYAQPIISGWGTFNNGELKILDLVNPLTDVRAYFRMNNETIFIDSAYAYVPGGGEWLSGLEELIPRRKEGKSESSVRASGTMRLVTLGRFEYDIDVSSENFFFISDSYDVRGLADLELRIVGETPPTVYGDVNLLRLEVRDEFEKFIAPDYDPNLVVEDSTIWNLDLDISAVNNLWIKNNEVDAELKGDLYLERHVGILTILGSLDVIRGTYNLLGQKFRVQRGSMLFNNLAVVNPDLDFTVTTRLRGQPSEISGPQVMDVELHITGTLLEPEINVGSESVLSREDLLKFLITRSQVNPFATGPQTSTSQNLIQGILPTLTGMVPGFEELELSPAERRISLAKYVSRSLYVRYSQRLTVDPGRTIGVEYYLNNNVSFNVTRGVQGTQNNEGISFDLNLNFEY